ncbi:hypothetical protein EV646_112196 [Kribbella antiqua]|uniref:Uncharacterized protein n=1 Tax=Kribbella antiqua TaxID=2512217 RepID=A0A4R2IIH8_9ACTN|nr:hypothetical protein [Kribbella antiqua]TCO43619.1 hypothetical protein EV646_112196 [Kribbella antiqua]
MIWDEPVGATYFAESDPHDPVGPKQRPDLRACLLLHLLFTPRLVIGDSQALNNPAFRALLTDESGTPSADSDIAPLLARGDLVIAKRTGQTLAEIRAGHAAGDVVGVPPVEYAAFLDEIATEAWEWEPAAIAAEFKANSLLRLSEVAGESPDPQQLAAVRNWAEEREPLLYNDLRKRLREVDGPTYDLVDRLVGIEYRMGLPNALGMPTADSATSLSSPFAYLSFSEPTEIGAVRTWVLRPEALAKLPVAAVMAAAELPASRTVKDQLGKIEVGLEPDLQVLYAALDELVRRLESAALELAEGGDAAALKELKRRPARVRLWKAVKFSALSTGLCVGFDVHSGGLPGRLPLVAQLITIGASMARDIRGAQREGGAAELTDLVQRADARRDGAGLLKRVVLPPQ